MPCNHGHRTPAKDKNGAQNGSDGAIKEDPSCKKPPDVGCPDIPAADPEGQVYGSPGGSGQKQQVGQQRVPGPEGTEQTVIQPQPCAQQQRCPEVTGCLTGGGHPSSRCSQPPA